MAADPVATPAFAETQTTASATAAAAAEAPASSDANAVAADKPADKPAEPPKPRGSRCDIEIRHNKVKDPEVKYGLDNLDTATDAECALVLSKQYSAKGALESSTLEVNSPHLLAVLRRVVGLYPAVPADFSAPFEMMSPFRMFLHYWDELHDLADHESEGAFEDEEARSHLKLLIAFMERELGSERTKIQAMLATGRITYDTLWAIFRPGTIVFTEVDGQPWFLRLERTAYEEHHKIGKWLELSCAYTDFDGDVFGTAQTTIKLFQKKLFAAENPSAIDKLPAYPVQWLGDRREELEERLVARGVRFQSVNGMQIKYYNGNARYLKDPPWMFFDPDMDTFPGVWLSYMESGRVVLDVKTFKEDQYGKRVSVVAAEVSPRSEQMLCPPYTVGYSLARKDWCRFYIDNLTDIEWNKSALDNLVLDAERKSVLESLVMCHSFSDSARDDMKTKGKGLVVLLHGSPGSGKTLTAESVAEATEKALITSTLGDLNRDDVPSLFERRLKRLLQYATIWKAVVLLDEADVFLEARTENPTSAAGSQGHNALVAVFLKHLEYCSGIVFLTSNRVRVFDRAMKSRIHLSLEYRSPDESMRHLIWASYLSAVPADERGRDLKDLSRESRVLATLLADELNGREIANCVNTARTIARFKRIPLGAAHIETVLSARKQFDRSLDFMRSKGKRGTGEDCHEQRLVRRGTLEAGSEDD